MNKKIVFTSMEADVKHPGNLNIIQEASDKYCISIKDIVNLIPE